MTNQEIDIYELREKAKAGDLSAIDKLSNIALYATTYKDQVETTNAQLPITKDEKSKKSTQDWMDFFLKIGKLIVVVILGYFIVYIAEEIIDLF